MKGFDVPDGFSIDKSLSAGDHPLLEVFPGLDNLALFKKLAKTKKQRECIIGVTIKLILSKYVYMYVAPNKPLGTKYWKPIISSEDCVVIGINHLKTSPIQVVYLDIFHELCHILQRKAGGELWSLESYVDNPCEIEAYQFVINEAKKLGAANKYLRDYLEVGWVSKKDMKRLFSRLEVDD